MTEAPPADNPPTMTAHIHPSAHVHPSAELGADCVVEATASVGAGARLGEGCRVGFGAFVADGVVLGPKNVLHPRATVVGKTTMGQGNQVFPGAVLGGPPQDLFLPGSDTRLEIGDGNVFREHVTVNTGTPKEQGVTRVGNRNLFMAGSHAGHDCSVEDNCILTNAVMLAGHVHVQRGAVIGGGVVCPPFLTVGRFSHIGGFCASDRDIPPFLIVHGGYQARVCGVNVVGLRRNGFSAEAIRALQLACQRLYIGKPASFTAALSELEADPAITPEVRYLCEFTRASLAGRFMRAREVIRMRK
jgi:UDP-N-acetylglucosamine acyltransferase